MAYAALDKFAGPDGMIRVQETLETIAGQMNNLNTQIQNVSESSKKWASNVSNVAKGFSDVADDMEDLLDTTKEYNDVIKDSQSSSKNPFAGTASVALGILDTALSSADKNKIKNHEGTKFVTKKKTPYDNMFGVKEDETLSILKVGEAVIPKDENLKMSSYGNYLDKEVSDNLSKMTYKKEYSVGNSSTSVSIGDIIIQGSADENTVLALRKERESIVKSVFDRIQSHNQRSGFRNMKLTPI